THALVHALSLVGPSPFVCSRSSTGTMFLPVRLALLTNQSACATASPGALDGSAKWYAPNARPAASASCLFVSYLGSRKVVPWVTLAITKRVPPCLTLFQSM